jgi:DUF2914 family protein
LHRWTGFVLGAAVLAGTARAEDSPLRASEVVVCEEVVERSCRSVGTTFPADQASVSFLTRIEGATGDAFVFHVWRFEGEEVRRVKLPVRNASYRTWSTKAIRDLPGRWKAEVLDPLGRSLGAVSFQVLAPER